MSYSINKIADQVYLRVTGGVPSDDVNVERKDVRSLVPGAINEAADKHVRIQLNDAVKDFREFGIGKEGIAQDLLLNHTLSVVEDTTRSLPYVVLPGSVMYLPGDRGLRQAFIPGGEFNVSFRAVPGAYALAGMPDITGAVFMWREKTGTESRVYFKGLGLPKPEQIVVRAAISVGALNKDTELPITDHIALDAINILTDYFTKQRQIPEDPQNTAIDEKV